HGHSSRQDLPAVYHRNGLALFLRVPNRHPHAIALRWIAAKPYPTDDPYGMPRRAGDVVAKHRAIEHVVFGWPKTTKQHNALAVVLAVVVSDVQTQIAITYE